MSFLIWEDFVIYHSEIPGNVPGPLTDYFVDNGATVRGSTSLREPCAKQNRHLAEPSLQEDMAKWMPDFCFAFVEHPVRRMKRNWARIFGQTMEPLVMGNEFHLFCENVFAHEYKRPYLHNNAFRRQVEFVTDNFELFLPNQLTELREKLSEVYNREWPEIPVDEPFKLDFLSRDDTYDLICAHRMADLELYHMIKDA